MPATLLLPEVKGSDADVVLTQETERVKHREKIWVDWGPKFIKEQSMIEGQSVIETQMVWSVKCKLALLWPRRVSPLYPAPSVAGSSVNQSVHILLEYLHMINEAADMLHRVVVEHVRSSRVKSMVLNQKQWIYAHRLHSSVFPEVITKICCR